MDPPIRFPSRLPCPGTHWSPDAAPTAQLAIHNEIPTSSRLFVSTLTQPITHHLPFQPTPSIPLSTPTINPNLLEAGSARSSLAPQTVKLASTSYPEPPCPPSGPTPPPDTDLCQLPDKMDEGVAAMASMMPTAPMDTETMSRESSAPTQVSAQPQQQMSNGLTGIANLATAVSATSSPQQRSVDIWCHTGTGRGSKPTRFGEDVSSRTRFLSPSSLEPEDSMGRLHRFRSLIVRFVEP